MALLAIGCDGLLGDQTLIVNMIK